MLDLELSAGLTVGAKPGIPENKRQCIIDANRKSVVLNSSILHLALRTNILHKKLDAGCLERNSTDIMM